MALRQIWERYRTNNGGDVLTAIDQMLRNQYATNLADRFPEFAWNNYFLNAGTYTRWIDLAYTAVDNLPQFEFRNGSEWRLFRTILQRQDDQAGPLVLRVPQYPFDGPAIGDPDRIDHWGVVYIEFLPNNPNQAVDLNLQIRIPGGGAFSPADYPRVSVIPIPAGSLTTAPHPPNNFLQPTVVPGSSEGLDLLYTNTTANFNTMDRVAVIIFNTTLNRDTVPYLYSASLVPR